MPRHITHPRHDRLSHVYTRAHIRAQRNGDMNHATTIGLAAVTSREAHRSGQGA